MTLLFISISLAIGVSFICSILEAVLLSVNSAYIVMMEKEGKKAGKLLKGFKRNIGQPLAAILTLNTISHTIGAAVAGAQATVVFGDAYLGVFSGVLTLLILIFSEIIPKTIGARYWRELAPVSAHILKHMIWLLYPFVKLSESLTRGLHNEPTLSGFSREEFSAMADLSTEEGLLEAQESHFIKNLLLLRSMRVKDAMTPRTVIFSLPDKLLVDEYFHKYDKVFFSRVPIYSNTNENIIGYVFRSDLLLAKARGNGQKKLSNYIRPIPAIVAIMPLKDVFSLLIEERTHIMLAVDEYGSVQGIITLEDVIETALGLEIVDEKDKAIDMQKEARKLWNKRMKDKGIKINE